MGVPKLAESLGLPLQEAEVLLDKYNAMMPFVLPTANKAKAVAEKRGYVRTLMGRRSRFKHYSGSTRRQYTHKALNRILQGSGADMIKMAMIVVYRELGKIPLLSNHDENNYNIVEHSEAKVLAELMENALPIAVPNRIDAGVGKNWSEAHG
jgi:DNA polymerase-1